MMRTGNARFFPLLVVAALASYWLFPDYLVLLTQIFVLATLALFYDLLQGFAGIVSLGHAAFFAIGAYTAALIAQTGYNEPVLGLVAAAILSALVAAVLTPVIARGNDLTRLLITLGAAAPGWGWVPQERDILPSLTVEENLRVAARPGRMDLQAVYGLFPRLRERRRNMGDKLSGGEQQMLAIGRTLMTNPRLLLLDEPFEGLAPVIVDEIEDTMARLRTEFRFAIVIVEQHAEDVLQLSDRGAVLDRGRVVLEDRSEALLADFARVRQWISV